MAPALAFNNPANPEKGSEDKVAKRITIRGSFVGTRQDLAEALAFAAAGKVKADIELRPLSSINEIFGWLQHDTVASRAVIDLPSS